MKLVCSHGLEEHERLGATLHQVEENDVFRVVGDWGCEWLAYNHMPARLFVTKACVQRDHFLDLSRNFLIHSVHLVRSVTNYTSTQSKSTLVCLIARINTILTSNCLLLELWSHVREPDAVGRHGDDDFRNFFFVRVGHLSSLIKLN